MSTQVHTLSFIRLSDCRKALGTNTNRNLVRDLHSLSDKERREIADLIAKEVQPQS
jgi:hypothetical protein